MAYGPRKRIKTKAGKSTLLGQTYRLNAPGVPAGTKSEVINHIAVPDANRPDFLARSWDEKHHGPPFKEGGLFSKISVETPWTTKGLNNYHGFNTGSFQYHYEGGFCPTIDFGPGTVTSSQIGSLGLSGAYGESFLSAEPYGARAYNQARPKLAKAGADVFIGELKDLPGQLRTTAQGLKDIYLASGGKSSVLGLMSPKNVSDHFLNHVFGWAPFVSDIQKLWDVYNNTNQIIAQLKRDNGRWIHRFRTVEKINDLTLHPRVYTPNVQPSLNGLLYNRRTFEGHSNCNGYTDYTTQSLDTVWFEGVFKYYVPDFDPRHERYHRNFSKVMQLLTIYGLRVSPATVWKLTPWSWLADWAFNVGDVLDNVVAAGYDHLVSKYAFVMRHRIKLNSMTAVVFLKNYGDTLDTWIQNLDSKDRRVATPFGFAFDMSTLTDKQILILAALGITRAP